jgi:hypothetical protein
MTHGTRTRTDAQQLDECLGTEERLLADLRSLLAQQLEAVAGGDAGVLADVMDRRERLIAQLADAEARVVKLASVASVAQRERMRAISEDAGRIAAEDRSEIARLGVIKDQLAAELRTLAASSRAHGAYGVGGPAAPTLQDREA